ncbi:MAG: hypothetical protein K2K94_03325, partial [Muribaculaceae bacterium]|nr:hypothetical protein [Muribaculaceae bacterium]
MKKIFLTMSLAMGAFIAYASSPEGVWQTISKHSAAHRVAVMAADAEGEGEEAPDPETPEVEPKWVSIGECAYTDEAVYSCWSVGPQTFNVDLEYDTNHPGMYRIVNPWKNYPASALAFVENHEDNPGKLLLGDEYYILINATDPEKVYVEESPIGIVYTDVVYNEETGVAEVVTKL